MITFGENVLLWRLHRSLSQERLAKLANIPRPNLSDIEKGKRDVRLTTLRSLSVALGVKPGILADGIPPAYKKRKDKLSRSNMESLAKSVAYGIPPKKLEERETYNLLREILNCSLKCARKPKTNLPMPTRKACIAWLKLRVLYSREILNSLIRRSREHAERI